MDGLEDCCGVFERNMRAVNRVHGRAGGCEVGENLRGPF